jgi:hypothetical protein
MNAQTASVLAAGNLFDDKDFWSRVDETVNLLSGDEDNARSEPDADKPNRNLAAVPVTGV